MELYSISDLFITMILQIDFSTIYHYWSSFLWPDRQSKIEPTSAMRFLGQYDLKNLDYEPTFIAYVVDDNIAGVNSGHKCMDNGYRSRGLYVLPEHRGKGIAVKLLQATIDQGMKENCNYVWSYPRHNSWTSYAKAGFELASNWSAGETGINAYCKKELVPNTFITHSSDES
jgi:GNAT superfamily N-acetyltransferase